MKDVENQEDSVKAEENQGKKMKAVVKVQNQRTNKLRAVKK